VTATSENYVYDPADPTPSLHGPMVIGGSHRRDMSALEARADTVSFTGSRLEQDLDAIGHSPRKPRKCSTATKVSKYPPFSF
jgi:predicted acyl esterase